VGVHCREQGQENALLVRALKKVMTSFGFGGHSEMLRLALPSFYKYADLHGYDLFLPSRIFLEDLSRRFGWSFDRPYSWYKVPLIKHLLSDYEVVLWMDADIIINRFDLDVNPLTDDAGHIQAFVVHQTRHGNIPNMGVWILNKAALPLLDDIWKQDQFKEDYFWEQAANIHVMNWARRGANTNMTDYGMKSLFVPYEFNVHKDDRRFNKDMEFSGRFLHATMYPDRISKMKEWVRSKKWLI